MRRTNLSESIAAAWTSLALFAAAVGHAGAVERTAADPGSPEPAALSLSAPVASRPGSPARFARTGYAWPHATGPTYGRADGRRAGALHTPVGSFDPAAGLPDFPRALRAETPRAGHGYVVIQLSPGAAGPEIAAVRAWIDGAGGAVVGRWPVGARIVRLPADAFAAISTLESLPTVSAVLRYHPALKLDPAIGRVPLTDPWRAVSDVYRLDVLLHPGEIPRPVAAALQRLGGTVSRVTADSLRVDIHRSRLAAVAAIEAVARVWEHVPALPHAEETTTTIQTGRYRNGATPYHDAGIRGADQILMVLDTGIQLDAAELADTAGSPGVPGNDPANADPSGNHRKVLFYGTAVTFGGSGDLSGCDDRRQGALTHGHVTASVAAGNATRGLPAAYGDGIRAEDPQGGRWALDGVAPGARLVVYDALATPAFAGCDDPTLGTIDAGDLYAAPDGGALGDAYLRGARVAALSWGAPGNTYGLDATDIDDFIADKPDALVVTSAGNLATDADENGFPDTGSLASLATLKNGLVLGAGQNADDFFDPLAPENRAPFSGVGPTPAGRIAPQLMAPGADDGSSGLPSELVCTSGDNDQDGAVLCDVKQGVSGTSVSAAAAAGAAVLVRDYFARGFYPSGAAVAGDELTDVSAALVKATLIASADFMTGDGFSPFPSRVCDAGFCFDQRGNVLQGWGRIRLDHALPLASWAPSPPGMLIVDGGIDGNPADIAGLTGSVDAVVGDGESGTFFVSDDTAELRVALAWVEDAGDALLNDLGVSLVSPSGVLYQGNYFTDDDDRDNRIDPLTEDCSAAGEPPGQNGRRDAGGFSLPVCARVDLSLPPKDDVNPIEAIVLSPDPDGDPRTDDSQIETGAWSITVEAASGGFDTAQRYALVVVGGVRTRSGARFDRGEYVCNTLSELTVTELAETGDLAPTAAEVASRTTLSVLDGNGVEVDSEPGTVFGFFRPDPSTLRFVADEIALSDRLARDPGNGVLDVRSGDTIRASYVDVDAAGTPDPGKTRVAEAAIECRVRISFGSIVFAQFGEDTTFRVNGGCERNARGKQEFGFPDRYLDAGENIIFSFAFSSAEAESLENAVASLRCVEADDALADADCIPASPLRPGCLNSTRALDGATPHTACAGLLTVRNSPMVIGKIPPGAALAANFNIDMAPTIDGTPLVELVLEVTAETAGRTVAGVAVSRQRLDVDADEILYSTDFPTGGTEFRDGNDNELIENPTTHLGDFLRDYRFETIVYGDLTAGGTKNMGLDAPWHFDTSHGNFTSGLGAATTESTIADTIAQWGEDKNFNDLDDKRCNTDLGVACLTKTDCVNAGVCGAACSCDSIEDRDPVNGTLDRNWSTLGGCGWQTLAPATCSGDASVGCYDDADCVAAGAGSCTGAATTTGGIWHTGSIRDDGGGTCVVNGTAPGQCQTYETVSGETGQRLWHELLLTPEIEKVSDDDGVRVEIVDFAWNMAIDLQDSNVGWGWEVDTDVERLEPVDLVADAALLNFGVGAYGAIINESSTGCFTGSPVFAPTGGPNGSAGNDRAGRNNCEFTVNDPGNPNCLALSRPQDDDLNNGYCAGDVNARCLQDSPDCDLAGGPCLFDNGAVDEYVTPNGPIRNFDLFAFNGPDMRFTTVEDRYRPSPPPPPVTPAAAGPVIWLETAPARTGSADPSPRCGGGPDG